MKSVAKKLLASMFVLAVAGSVTVHAQRDPAATSPWNNVQVGTLLTCNTIPSPITIRVNGRDLQGISQGGATFQVTTLTAANPDDPNSVNSATWSPVAVQATTTINGFGTITTSLGGGQVTSGISSTTPAPFPVTSTMGFPAVANVNGVTYTSRTPVSLTAPQANSFAPFQNERFSLDAPVDFVDDAGNVGFTLVQFNPTFNR